MQKECKDCGVVLVVWDNWNKSAKNKADYRCKYCASDSLTKQAEDRISDRKEFRGIQDFGGQD